MKTFRWLNVVFGAALIAAGLLLTKISVIEIAQPPTSDAFHLLQFHFVLTGVTSLFVARSRGDELFVAIFLLFVVIINFWIGGIAIFSRVAEHIWTLIFPIVSFLNLGQIFTQPNVAAHEKTESHSGIENEIAEVEFEDIEDFYPLIRPDIWEIKSFGIGDIVKSVLWATLYVPALLLIATLIMVYGNVLQAVIFDDANISFARAGSALLRGFIEQWPLIAVLTVTLGITFLIQTIFSSIAAKGDLRRSDDVNRALNDEERRYLADSLKAVLEYVKNKSFGAFPRLVLVIFGPLPIVTMLAAPFLIISFEGYAAEKAMTARFEGLDVLVQNGPALVGGAAAGFLFGIAAGWALLQWVGGRHFLLAQYLHAKVGWNTMSSQERSVGDHIKILTRFVRLRRLNPEKEFRPDEFLYRAFREREQLIYRTAMILGIATALFTMADMCWFQVVHTQGVLYSNYLTPFEKQLEFSAFDRIELRCFRFDKGDDGVARLATGYRLKKDGEVSVDILMDAEETPDYLDRLEAVDARLQSAGVPFVRARRAGLLWAGKTGYLEDCGDQLKADYEPAIAARLARLLRVRSPN